MCEFENCVSLWLYKFRVTLYTGTCTKPELSGKFIACCAAQVPPPQPQSPLNPVYPVTEFLWGLRCKEKSTHLLHPSTACSSDYNTDILILEMHVHPSPLEAASHLLVTCARHCSLHFLGHHLPSSTGLWSPRARVQVSSSFLILWAQTLNLSSVTASQSPFRAAHDGAARVFSVFVVAAAQRQLWRPCQQWCRLACWSHGWGAGRFTPLSSSTYSSSASCKWHFPES